jgi:hypothetical protein
MKVMNLDELMGLMIKFTYSDKKTNELGEQEDAATGGATGGGSEGYPTVTKWETGLTRGKANSIDSKSKWTTGLTRGKANTLL